jgi:hypothetical protein
MVAARNEERVSRATYDSVGSPLDELVHESCALERVADLPVRPRLGVVVFRARRPRSGWGPVGEAPESGTRRSAVRLWLAPSDEPAVSSGFFLFATASARSTCSLRAIGQPAPLSEVEAIEQACKTVIQCEQEDRGRLSHHDARAQLMAKVQITKQLLLGPDDPMFTGGSTSSSRRSRSLTARRRAGQTVPAPSRASRTSSRQGERHPGVRLALLCCCGA